ncbi:MAG: hypothetical protein BWY44_00139 [Candidatus Omnitrophica bacterium ADurb.Bin292]|nr:MAG: hypothetical protein BWY44_00139 [Candidatus Omnitrophica bacterium ADurb.Bin292]
MAGRKGRTDMKDSGSLILSGRYQRLRSAIKRELVAGEEKLKRVFREEGVRRMWTIGKILRKELGLGDSPSRDNALLVSFLCRDFGRPESFFYDAAKFHRLYPGKPPLRLSLAHYLLLIRVEDETKRRALEQKTLRENLNTQSLRLLTRSPAPAPGFLTASGTTLDVVRGVLYHYRVSGAPDGGRIGLDIGFGIERNVRCPPDGSLHSGLIVRAVKEGEDYSIRVANFEKTRLYTYAATLDRVVDGDTIVARVDLGFRTYITGTFRLRGLDAPELGSTAGQRSKLFVTKTLEPCAFLVIRTYKQEKYGRFLADVFYMPGVDDKEKILRDGKFLNQELLDGRLAVPYQET